VTLLRRGHKDRLPSLSEAEAYARCHGGRSADVRIVTAEARPRREFEPPKENLREALARRLDERKPSEEAEERASAS
jgi:hypothetical protein